MPCYDNGEQAFWLRRQAERDKVNKCNHAYDFIQCIYCEREKYQGRVDFLTRTICALMNKKPLPDGFDEWWV